MARTALQTAGGTMAAGILAAAGGPVMAAAGGGSGARPSRVAGKIQLIVSVAYQGADEFTGTFQTLVDQYLQEHWTAKHPGVQVTTVAGNGCNGNCSTASDFVTASLAGEPTDVITGCCSSWSTYLAGNIMRPLDPFIRQANFDTGIFSKGHLAGLTTPQGIMALPEYDGPMVWAVNLDMLNDLGVATPSQDWTYQEAESIWRSVARTKGSTRIYGASPAVWNEEDNWVPTCFGGLTGSADGTACLLNQPKSVASYNWWTPLYLDNVVGLDGGGSRTQMAQGTCAMSMEGGWDIQRDLLQLEGVNWQYYGMPRFPSGQTTFINNDFYAINNYSKNPADLVWDIFTFLVKDRGFLQLQFKTTFITPNIVSMWPDWIEMMEQVAPGLKGKNLQAFQGATEYGVAEYYFKYQSTSALNVLQQYLTEAEDNKLSVTEALNQATHQINALQSTGAQFEMAAASAGQALQAEVQAADKGTLKVFPAPATKGAGAPYTAAGSLVTMKNGSVTLQAAGALSGGTTVDGTFACAQAVAPHATYVCRLTAFANVNSNPMSQSATAGLMLRQDLSDESPCVLFNLSYSTALAVSVEPNVQVPVGNPYQVGVGAQFMNTPTSAKQNFLKAPIWLKMVRNADMFSFFTSKDGVAWQAAGPSVPLQIGGGWIGLYACSNAAPQLVSATFDQLGGWTPNRFVVLGG